MNTIKYKLDTVNKSLNDKINNFSNLGEVYSDFYQEISRRYYKEEDLSKLQRKRKTSDYLREGGLGIAISAPFVVAGAIFPPFGIAAAGAVAVASLAKEPINDAISKARKKTKAKNLEYITDIALTMTPEQIADFFKKNFRIDIFNELVEDFATSRKKLHPNKNLDLMLYGCTFLKDLKSDDFRNKLKEYAVESGISKKVEYHDEDLYGLTENETRAKEDKFFGIKQQYFMELKEQKDFDLMQHSNSKSTLQLKANASTGTAIGIASNIASLLLSGALEFVPGVSALGGIAKEAIEAGASAIVEGAVDAGGNKAVSGRSIKFGEFGEVRKFLKGLDQGYLFNYALIDKTDVELLDMANKFEENYKYYSGAKPQKMRGFLNRVERLWKYGFKSQKDNTLLREITRKTLKRLKKSPITLYESHIVGEYIELAKLLNKVDSENQNIILIRMEEIKNELMDSIIEKGDFSRWNGEIPTFDYFLNSFQLHQFVLGKGDTAKERVESFVNPEVSIGIGLEYEFIEQQQKFFGGDKFKFRVTKDPKPGTELYEMGVRAGSVLYIKELTFERAIEKLKNGEIEKIKNNGKTIKEKLKINSGVFVKNENGEHSFFNVNSTLDNKRDIYQKKQLEIQDLLQKNGNVEEIERKIEELSRSATSLKEFSNPPFYKGIGVTMDIDYETGEAEIQDILECSSLNEKPLSDYFKIGTKIKLCGNTKEEIMLSVNNFRKGKIEEAIESIGGRPIKEIIGEIHSKNPNGFSIRPLLIENSDCLKKEIKNTRTTEEKQKKSNSPCHKIADSSSKPYKIEPSVSTSEPLPNPFMDESKTIKNPLAGIEEKSQKKEEYIDKYRRMVEARQRDLENIHKKNNKTEQISISAY